MAHAISPVDLCALVIERLPNALVAFDVDGVLAPLAPHTDDSRLADGVGQALMVLADRIDVALASGRSLESLATLIDPPPGLHVLGSHGLERHGHSGLTIDADERLLLDRLVEVADSAVVAIGDGAWLEHKPAGVVLHTRQADPAGVPDAVARLRERVEQLSGAHLKPGNEVVELMARRGNKGTALMALREELGRDPLVFLGDDVTDEDTFRLMRPGHDVSVRVGPGETLAEWRLADSDASTEFVRLLAAAVT